MITKLNVFWMSYRAAGGGVIDSYSCSLLFAIRRPLFAVSTFAHVKVVWLLYLTRLSVRLETSVPLYSRADFSFHQFISWEERDGGGGTLWTSRSPLPTTVHLRTPSPRRSDHTIKSRISLLSIPLVRSEYHQAGINHYLSPVGFKGNRWGRGRGGDTTKILRPPQAMTDWPWFFSHVTWISKTSNGASIFTI